MHLFRLEIVFFHNFFYALERYSFHGFNVNLGFSLKEFYIRE